MVRSIGREELEQRKVEEAAALLAEMVDGLRRHPSNQMASVAREALAELRPHVESALETLETIERDRDLTERERGLYHAFTMLLAVREQIR
jgi:hypothetical protein